MRANKFVSLIFYLVTFCNAATSIAGSSVGYDCVGVFKLELGMALGGGGAVRVNGAIQPAHWSATGIAKRQFLFASRQKAISEFLYHYEHPNNSVPNTIKDGSTYFAVFRYSGKPNFKMNGKPIEWELIHHALWTKELSEKVRKDGWKALYFKMESDAKVDALLKKPEWKPRI